MGRNVRTAVAFLLLGAISAGGYFLFQQYDRDVSALATASISWPRVAGLVTSSDLEYWRAKAGNSEGATEARVRVSYEYVVDGQLYENDVVRFDQQMLSREQKEILIGLYPAGKRVDVFYDPDDPALSVLVPGSWSIHQ